MTDHIFQDVMCVSVHMFVHMYACIYVSIPLVHLMWWRGHTSIRPDASLKRPQPLGRSSSDWMISEARSSRSIHPPDSLLGARRQGDACPWSSASTFRGSAGYTRTMCGILVNSPSQAPRAKHEWTNLQMIKAKLGTQAFKASSWGLQHSWRNQASLSYLV